MQKKLFENKVYSTKELQLQALRNGQCKRIQTSSLLADGFRNVISDCGLWQYVKISLRNLVYD